MPLVTVSSKNQVTLPAQIVREMGLKAGSKLVIECMDGRIVAIPEPESWVNYVAGSARGLYGGSKETIDRYVAEERAAWSLPSTGTDEFEDYYVRFQGTDRQRIIDALANQPLYVATSTELARISGVDLGIGGGILEELVRSGWVRRIDAAGEPKFRLRRECAQAIRAA